MEIDDETQLSLRENLVFQGYSKGPRKSEDLQNELKKKMSRPTFYRAQRHLLAKKLIYVISDEEKKQFGLIDKLGLPLKHKYYFRRDEGKAQKWNKIMQKVREYEGVKSPYYLMNLIQREFSGYPLISLEDVIQITEIIGKMPKREVYTCGSELFKFLEPQVKRMKSRPTKDRKISDAVRRLFELFTNDLLGATETNVNDWSEKSFDILCNIYTGEEARGLIDSIYSRRTVDDNKEAIRGDLMENLIEIYSKHFDAHEKNAMVASLRDKIAELDDREVELSLDENPRQLQIVSGLRNCLVQALNKIPVAQR